MTRPRFLGGPFPNKPHDQNQHQHNPPMLHQAPRRPASLPPPPRQCCTTKLLYKSTALLSSPQTHALPSSPALPRSGCLVVSLADALAAMAATAVEATARAWVGGTSAAGAPAQASAGTALQRQARIPAGATVGVARGDVHSVVTARVAQRTQPELYDGIANFYDESSGVWEEVWGEHMHHGYYDDEVVTAATKGDPDHRRAQIKMIEKSLAYAGVPGMGTNSLYLHHSHRSFPLSVLLWCKFASYPVVVT
jgi:hypothetical protein